jgi:iron complex outermembrane receptor protein
MTYPLAPRVLLAVLFFCFLAINFASAQKSVDIDPVTLTLSRFDAALEKTPANVTIISSEEIERSAATSVPELLRRYAGIFTSMDFFGNGSDSAKVDLRAFGSVADENTLILVDGRRVKDNDLSAVNWSSIPLKFIERIEIHRGGGAVLYGRGATAGVINIVTMASGKRDNFVEIEGTTGTYNTDSGAVSGSFGTDEYGLAVNTYTYTSDNYRSNNKETRHSGQLAYEFYGETVDTSIQIGTSQQNVRFPGALVIQPSNGTDEVKALGRRGSSTPNEFARAMETYVAGDLNVQSYDSQIMINFGWRSSDDESFFEAFNDTYAERDRTIWHFSPRLRRVVALGSIEHDIKFGFDYERWSVTRNASDAEQNISDPHNIFKSEQRNYGLYVEDSLALSDLWMFSVGARWDEQTQTANDTFDANAPGAAAKFESEAPAGDQKISVSGYELNLQRELQVGGYIGASTNKSYRLANVDEIGAVGEFDSTFNKVFQFLRPQISHTHQLFFGRSTSNYAYNVNLFQIDTRDEIRLDLLTTGAGNTNFPLTKRQGFEVQTSFTEQRFSVSSTYGYTRAKFSRGFTGTNDLSGKTIPLTPKHSVNVTGTYLFPNAIDLSMDFNYFSEQVMDNDEPNIMHTNIPDSSVTNVKLSKKSNGWKLGAGISNLFDREYHTYAVASGFTPTRFGVFPLPERVFYLTIGKNFGI